MSAFHNRSILRFLRILLLPGALAWAGWATAAPVSIPVDSSKSYVKFVGDSFLHDFHGAETRITGSADWDGAGIPSIQKASLVFPVAGVTTFHKKRDEEMFHWLHAKLHPQASFQCEGIRVLSGDCATATAQAPARVAISGTFELNGVRQPLNSNALWWREGSRILVSGKTTVDTLQYGLPQIKKAFMTVGTTIPIDYRFAFVLPQ
ncbi:YceI family protein [Methylacidimicrobium sp. B4]|uniref:YceI family protein n=1 Tax=Methylacidimicrobium sp. B4 TaxID=2796139 RepID=UPI001A8CE96A|nr:YceI family protein [Methylacidimicrobium sp. B4]QSR85580.1 YceI family protein [Methylacidimicrobium sp. B4]